MSNIYVAPFVHGSIGDTLTFTITGTSTPQNIYADLDLTTPLNNPIEADAEGDFPVIYLNPELPPYRVDYKDINGLSYPGYPVDDVIASGDQATEFLLKGSTPGLLIHETAAGANEGKWRVLATGGVLTLALRNDANTSGDEVLRVTRSGSTIDEIEIGGKPYRQSGTFTGTGVYLSGSPTTNVKWDRNGNMVTLRIDNLTGTSTDARFEMTGLPANLRPSLVYPTVAIGAGTDNGAATTGLAAVIAPSGTIAFYRNGASNGWTATGTKALAIYTTITYTLDG